MSERDNPRATKPGWVPPEWTVYHSSMFYRHIKGETSNRSREVSIMVGFKDDEFILSFKGETVNKYKTPEEALAKANAIAAEFGGWA